MRVSHEKERRLSERMDRRKMPSETMEIIINRQISQNFYREEMIGYTGRKDTGPAVLKL